MKLFISIILMLEMSNPSFAQSSQWYVFGGATLWEEDRESFDSDGLSTRFGVGWQPLEKIGLELVWDSVPDLGSFRNSKQSQRIHPS